MATRGITALTALSALALLACGGEGAGDRPETMGVDLVLSPTGAAFVGHFDPHARILRRARSEHRLVYEFRNERDEIISGGIVDDPRMTHLEYTNEAGETAHFEIANQSGLLSLRLPNRAGELRVLEAGAD
ncbi:MAG: hypothetical protein KJO07_24645, partial [Deltaproteobacteria bacterium]|nr:hypothetical protein [Deltaproteobacteria bacterium]